MHLRHLFLLLAAIDDSACSRACRSNVCPKRLGRAATKCRNQRLDQEVLNPSWGCPSTKYAMLNLRILSVFSARHEKMVVGEKHGQGGGRHAALLGNNMLHAQYVYLNL